MYDQYSALIFDMDGTLVDSGQLHEYAWSEMLKRYELPINRALMRSLTGVPTKATITIIADKYHLPLKASLDEMHEYKEQLVHEAMHRFVKPTALIEIARRYHGIKPMAVGTGAYTNEAHSVLKLCGLDTYISAVVGADQVTHPKPAPDTFLRCAELLNVDPKQCVVFEDSPLGLQAAADAGMAGIDVLLVHNVANDYFL